ncbi:unnamed protein product [Schistosoma turkestanicum]|nr:unnamed protein product [Schistosoma turkestanicum]
MLHFEENSPIITSENDVGSDQETNISYSENSNQTPSIEIASMSSTISLTNALISTKTIDNTCDKQEKLINLLNSNFLSCSFCYTNENIIKLLPCLHTICQNCVISLSKHLKNQNNSLIKCKACHLAGLQLREQYNPNNQSFTNGTLENNISDDKCVTIQLGNNLTNESNQNLEKEETMTVDELQFPNAIFIEKLRDLANLLQKDSMRKCDYCMFENQNSEAQCSLRGEQIESLLPLHDDRFVNYT